MAPKKPTKDAKKDEAEEPPAPLVGKFYYKSGATYEGEYKHKALVDAEGNPIPVAEGDPPPPRIREGQGEYIEPDGHSYKGGWLDDKCHGQGVFKFASGAMYDGEWKENKYHGKGKFTFTNGSYYEGEWANSAFHGKGVYVDAAEHQWSGDFFNGTGPGLVNLL